MSISGTTHQKLVILRKRLDQMGYYEPLTIEALPLIEQLFSDLVHTTESLKNAKLQSTQIQREKSCVEKYIEPYKNENAKLIKENNKLHQKLIHLKEKSDADVKEVKSKLRTFEHENADLRFLNTQYLQKVRAMEKDALEKSELIMQLQEKNAQAVIQTPGGKKQNIPFRRQRMEILEPLAPRIPITRHQKVWEEAQDVYIADMLQIADENMRRLQKENSDVLNVLSQAEEVMKDLEKKVEVREKEIERLTIQLEGGRPLDAVMKESEEREKDRIISHLNIQVEHLQNQNQELENQLIELEGKSSRMPSTPHRKQTQAKDRDFSASTYRDTQESTVNDRSPRTRRRMLPRNDESERKNLDEPLHQKNKELKILLTNKDEEQVRLEKLINQLQQEKDRLSKKVAELTANEKDLVLEIDRLSKRSSSRERSRSPPCPSARLARLIHLLEAQRDHYKQEVQTLQKIVQSSQTKNIAERHSVKGITRVRPRPPGKMSKDEGFEKQNDSSVLKLLEEERDFYKERFKELMDNENRVSEPSKTSVDKGVSVVDEELLKLLSERDRLLAKVKDLEDQLTMAVSTSGESEKHRFQRKNLEKALEELQKHLEEAQSRIENISKEKEDINFCYQQVLQENNQLRTQLSSTDQGYPPGQEISYQRTEERIERYKSVAEDNLFKERLKKTEEAHIIEKNKLQQQNEQLQNALLELQKQENKFQESLTSHKVVISTLQEQITTLQCRLSQVEEESVHTKAAATQIRILADQGENSLEQMKQNIFLKDGELEAAEERLKHQQNKITEYIEAIQHLQKEIADLRSSMANAEEEKQQLLRIAEDHNSRVSSLQQQMFSKEEHAAQLRITVTTLEDHVDKLQKELREKDQEIHSLNEQMKAYNENTVKLSQTQEILTRENSRLLDDLSTMTRENQTINQQLERALQQQQDLKRQVQEYVTEVQRIQELLIIKEQQRTELLQQYQSLSQENTALEAQNQQLESQTSTAHLEVMAKDAELKHYRDTITSLEQEIDEYMASQQTHQMELTMLNTSVNGLEQELLQSKKEVETLEADLAAARALCVQLDATRNELQRRVVIEETERTKISAEVERLHDEVRALRSQLTSERTQVLSLEGLMASSREAEFRNHLANQELGAELKLLRDRLIEGEQKLENQSKDIAMYKTKAAELEMEVERLRRQMTNERFERERANQELQRLQRHHQLYVTQTLESPLPQPASTGYPRITIQPPSPLDVASSSSKASSQSSSNKLISPLRSGHVGVSTITKLSSVSRAFTSEVRSEEVINTSSSRGSGTRVAVKPKEKNNHSSSTSGIVSQTAQLSAEDTTNSSTPRSVATSESCLSGFASAPPVLQSQPDTGHTSDDDQPSLPSEVQVEKKKSP